MNEAALVPVEEIPQGECFRKLQGTYAYIRISNNAAKWLGLKYETHVYGVCFNGNVTDIERGKLVVPVKPGKMDQNRATVKLWNKTFSQGTDDMNKITTLSLTRSIKNLRVGEHGTVLDGREVMKLEDNKAVFLETGKYVPNLGCLVKVNTVSVGQMKPGDFGTLEERTIFKLANGEAVYLANGTYVNGNHQVELKDSATLKRRASL